MILSHKGVTLQGLHHYATTSFSGLVFITPFRRCESHLAPPLKPVVSQASGSPGEFVETPIPRVAESAPLGEGENVRFYLAPGDATAVVPVMPLPSPSFPQLPLWKCCYIHLECHLPGNSTYTVSKPTWGPEAAQGFSLSPLFWLLPPLLPKRDHGKGGEAQ